MVRHDSTPVTQKLAVRVLHDMHLVQECTAALRLHGFISYSALRLIPTLTGLTKLLAASSSLTGCKPPSSFHVRVIEGNVELHCSVEQQ